MRNGTRRVDFEVSVIGTFVTDGHQGTSKEGLESVVRDFVAARALKGFDEMKERGPFDHSHYEGMDSRVEFAKERARKKVVTIEVLAEVEPHADDGRLYNLVRANLVRANLDTPNVGDSAVKIDWTSATFTVKE